MGRLRLLGLRCHLVTHSSERPKFRAPRLSRVARALTIVLLAAAAVLVCPMAANAAGGIEVSSDGVTFGPAYTGTLFDGVANIVPGDTQTEQFYLRNTGPDAGYLRITLRDVSGSPALIDSLTLSTSVPTNAGSPVALSQAEPCWVLNEGIFVAAHTTVTVTAEMVFDAASGNPSQGTAADFSIGVNLTDTAAALPPTDCGGTATVIPGTVPQPGELGYTGNEVPVMLIIVSALIMGAGLFLIVAARRRDREQDDEESSA